MISQSAKWKIFLSYSKNLVEAIVSIGRETYSPNMKFLASAVGLEIFKISVQVGVCTGGGGAFI